MARNNGKTVIYFTATAVPTAAELVEIGALEKDYEKVLVRRADTPAGLSAGSLEPADALAGSVPTSYKTAAGPSVDTALYPDGQLTVGADDKPEALLILPSASPSIAAAAGTIQLRLCMAQKNMTTGAVTLTDITADASVGWVSGTPAKATVGASTGLVTGAAGGAGSTVITATVTYDTNKTATATRTVTVT